MCGSAVRLQPPALRGPSGKGRVIRFNLNLKLKIFHCRSNTAESLTVMQSSLTLRTLGVSSDFLILGLIVDRWDFSFEWVFSKNLNVIVSISQINTTIISTNMRTYYWWAQGRWKKMPLAVAPHCWDGSSQRPAPQFTGHHPITVCNTQLILCLHRTDNKSWSIHSFQKKYSIQCSIECYISQKVLDSFRKCTKWSYFQPNF